jgi:hypothetical protein
MSANTVVLLLTKNGKHPIKRQFVLGIGNVPATGDKVSLIELNGKPLEYIVLRRHFTEIDIPGIGKCLSLTQIDVDAP